VWLCRARGSTLPAVGRPGAGRSTRHYSHDSALFRRGSGIAEPSLGHCCCAWVPAVSPDCRSGCFSFRHADRLLVRFVVGVTILTFGVMTAGFQRRGGRPWAPFGRRPTRDLAAGVAAALIGMAGPPGADLSVAGRDGGADSQRDASRILCAVIRATVASHAATVGIPGPTWVAAGILAPPSPCSAGLPGGRSASASTATALPFCRSRCSPSPGFIRWPPRVSVLSLANREHLGAADRNC
jgi:hypothetical protein